MADIIDFMKEQDRAAGSEQETSDAFLLEEGLELLSLYRAIKDADVRASIKRLIATLAYSAQRPND